MFRVFSVRIILCFIFENRRVHFNVIFCSVSSAEQVQRHRVLRRRFQQQPRRVCDQMHERTCRPERILFAVRLSLPETGPDDGCFELFRIATNNVSGVQHNLSRPVCEQFLQPSLAAVC